MPPLSRRPGTIGYWRHHRDQMWLLHGEGLNADEIAERTGFPIASVRMALRELDSEVRARRIATEAAERAARRSAAEERREAYASALAERRAEAKALRSAAAERKRQEKKQRARMTLEDRIMFHWAKGRDTYNIGVLVNRAEPFVANVLANRRDAAVAMRGAA